MTIFTRFLQFFAEAHDLKFSRPDLKVPPNELGRGLFFAVTRHLGQHIGQGIALPLSTSRFNQFSPGLYPILYDKLYHVSAILYLSIYLTCQDSNMPR